MNQPLEVSNTKLAILMGAVIAFLIAVGHLYWQVDGLRADVSSLSGSLSGEITKLREATALANNANRRIVAPAQPNTKMLEVLKAELKDELLSTKKQVGVAANRAKVEAVTHADTIVQQLGEEHQSQQKEVSGELGKIKQAEATTSSRVDEVSAEMTNVKNQVASTRYELERTAADLKRATGDLGVQSGLIATNAKELQVLKLLGERNYFDFHIQRTNQAQRVGDVSVLLKKTDPKHNKYTVEVIVGDKKTEKKEKGVNEPVQFYTSKSRMPLEIVVNEVQKDYIIGYLSTPKDLVARND